MSQGSSVEWQARRSMLEASEMVLKEGRKTSFLKKRSKKLLLLRARHLPYRCSTLRGTERAKVFWFFFPKKNAFL
jgi:hypothetical protein